MPTRKQALVVLAAFLLGLVLPLLKRPTTDGSFYTVCYGTDCELRMHVPWYKGLTADPVLGHGSMGAKQIGKDTQVSALELANALSTLPGYGVHYKPNGK